MVMDRFQSSWKVAAPIALADAVGNSGRTVQVLGIRAQLRVAEWACITLAAALGEVRHKAARSSLVASWLRPLERCMLGCCWSLCT